MLPFFFSCIGIIVLTLFLFYTCEISYDDNTAIQFLTKAKKKKKKKKSSKIPERIKPV